MTRSVFYSRLGIWIIFETQRFFIIPIFLRELSWRNSFALKRGGNCIFSITKFSEMWWKRWRFWGLWGTLEIVKKWSWNILLYEEILHYAALRSEWHGSVFYSRLGIWIILNAKIFYYSYIIKEAKLAKFIRYEAMWKLMWDEIRDASISITKFTKMVWNDGVFEGTEEHWKL